MKITEAVEFCLQYQSVHSKKRTIEQYEYVLGKFENAFKRRNLESIKTEEVIKFLIGLNPNAKPNTKRSRYRILSAFFTLVINCIFQSKSAGDSV